MARAVVAEVTGATVVRTDTHDSPPGTVDGWLTYPDGRGGALEVSTLTTSDEFELEGRIRRRGGQLPAPGNWKWVISLRDHRELARIESIYWKAIVLCEEHRVQTPDRLPFDVIDADDDLTWLWSESTTGFFGVMVPEGARDTSRTTDLSTGVMVSSWEDAALSLADTITGALAVDPLAKRVTKLLRADADERHLFLRVTASGISESNFYNLLQHAIWPDESRPILGDPVAPEGISHLWLLTGWGQKVTRWTRGKGWDHPGFGVRLRQQP